MRLSSKAWQASCTRLGFVVAGDLVDVFRGHLAGDVAHLLADVVAASAGRKSLQLRLDVDGRLAAEPRTARLVIDVAVAGAARGDVTHRCAGRDDRGRRHRCVELVRWHARQIGVIGGDIQHVLIAEIGRERTHDHIHPRPGLEIDQLLVGDGGKLPGQIWRIGVADALRPVADGAALRQRGAATD